MSPFARYLKPLALLTYTDAEWEAWLAPLQPLPPMPINAPGVGEGAEAGRRHVGLGGGVYVAGIGGGATAAVRSTDAVPTVRAWSRAETEALWRLAAAFDLRWVVMADRWDAERWGERSVDELKDRYYSLTRRLVEGRARLAVAAGASPPAAVAAAATGPQGVPVPAGGGTPAGLTSTDAAFAGAAAVPRAAAAPVPAVVPGAVAAPGMEAVTPSAASVAPVPGRAAAAASPSHPPGAPLPGSVGALQKHCTSLVNNPFDYEYECMRKAQLAAAAAVPKATLRAEEEVVREARRIEATRKRVAKERARVAKLAGPPPLLHRGPGVGAGASPTSAMAAAANAAAAGGGSVAAAAAAATAASAAANAATAATAATLPACGAGSAGRERLLGRPPAPLFPNRRITPGAYARSRAVYAPSASSARLAKRVDAVLEELGVGNRVTPTPAVVDAFDLLRGGVGRLVELVRLVTRKEEEVAGVRAAVERARAAAREAGVLPPVKGDAAGGEETIAPELEAKADKGGGGLKRRRSEGAGDAATAVVPMSDG